MTWQFFIPLIWCLYVVRSQYEPYGENVAYSKPANQSTTFDKYNASLGVDGGISTNFNDGTCSHTGEGPKYSWWTVDLVGFYWIKFIRIYQWTNSYVNRLNGAQMYAKEMDNTWKHITFNSSWPLSEFTVSVELNKPIGEIMLNNSLVQGAAAFICVCELQAFKVIECVPFSIENGSIEVVKYGDSNQTFTFGTQYKVTCHEGYRMLDNGVLAHETESVLECNATGNWSRNLTCSELATTFECNNGFNYTLPGNKTIRCGKGGHWTGILGLCEVIDCGRPLHIPGNSTAVSSTGLDGNTSYNATVTIHCNNGFNYTLPGNDTIICGIEGHWMGNLGLCKVIDCGQPLKIPGDSTIVFSTGLAGNTSYNATFTIHCNKGFRYTHPGNETIRCGNEGHWTDSLGLCEVIDCGQPLNIPGNSTIVFSTGLAGITSYSATFTIHCNKGFHYTLPGNETVRCGHEGHWTGYIGICEVTRCTEIVPPEYGVIVVEPGTEGRWSFNTTVVIICNTGYRLNGETLIKCLETGRWTNALGYCLALPEKNADEEECKTSVLGWVITGPFCLILLVTNIGTCLRFRRHQNSDMQTINNKSNELEKIIFENNNEERDIRN